VCGGSLELELGGHGTATRWEDETSVGKCEYDLGPGEENIKGARYPAPGRKANRLNRTSPSFFHPRILL
jgi:hypothetical protein